MPDVDVSATTSGASAHDEPDALAALRARDAHRRDPVRFRLAQALARRAEAQAGAAREAIEARLALLVADFDARLDAAPPPSPAVPAMPAAPATRGALAELVAHAGRQKKSPVLAASATPRPASPGKPAVVEPATLQFFQRTWSRLSAEQRLAQSRATLPDNAGPLNSQHLVHRSLTLMHALSPEYLERFVGYIDALQWLEQSNEAAEHPLVSKRAMAARR